MLHYCKFRRKDETDILSKKILSTKNFTFLVFAPRIQSTPAKSKQKLFLTHIKFTETPHNACPAARLEAPGCKPTTQGLSPTPAATQNAR